jgi:D-threo-aldose 1-dehydrogenase
LRAAALQFPAHHPAVSTILSGARSAAEITENAESFRAEIPGELWTALRREGLVAGDAVTPG